MSKKLVSKVDSEVAKKPRRYDKTSLSQPAGYSAVTKGKKKDFRILPVTRKLSGIVELPDNFDHKKVYYEHILNRYYYPWLCKQRVYNTSKDKRAGKWKII